MKAWRFILLMGLVSLLADMTYEGASDLKIAVEAAPTMWPIAGIIRKSPKAAISLRLWAFDFSNNPTEDLTTGEGVRLYKGTTV